MDQSDLELVSSAGKYLSLSVYLFVVVLDYLRGPYPGSLSVFCKILLYLKVNVFSTRVLGHCV